MELAIIALIAWLAWSRYLYHQELKLVMEKGGDWQRLVQVRERWQIRWGIVAGLVVLIVGAGTALSGLVIPMNAQERLAVYIIGASLTAVGLLIAIAHLIWRSKLVVGCQPPAAGAQK